MDEILGLPAHPLLVHGAVVLVPLAAAGVALIAFWPAARFRLGYAVLAIAAAGAMTAVLAQRTGGALEERVDETELIEEHTELGETGTTAGVAVLVAAVAVVGTDLALRRRASPAADGSTPAGRRRSHGSATAAPRRCGTRPPMNATNATMTTTAGGATATIATDARAVTRQFGGDRAVRRPWLPARVLPADGRVGSSRPRWRPTRDRSSRGPTTRSAVYGSARSKTT